MVFSDRSISFDWTNLHRSNLMDANKYKSVAIKVEVYNKARPMAEKDYCTMGGFISKLIEQESKKRKGKNGKAN
tara:strand:- start:297 stop:518 length:222 start_codon:yes stop_codon:yes gene_type:complete